MAVIDVSHTLVLVRYPVVALCEQQASECAGKNERGGILIGSLRSPHIEILTFTDVGPLDQSMPFRFVRQDPKHQMRATKAWKDSDERQTFLGEWHTHPSGAPVPSCIDTASWQKLAQKQRMQMVFIVVAPGEWSPYLVRPGHFWAKVHRFQEMERGKEGIVFKFS